jgi:hypothetical protein
MQWIHVLRINECLLDFLMLIYRIKNISLKEIMLLEMSSFTRLEIYSLYLFFYCLVVLWFVLSALHLLSRLCTIWATPQPIYVVIFQVESCTFLPRLASDYSPPMCLTYGWDYSLHNCTWSYMSLLKIKF